MCTRAMQDIICTVGPYASHDLARKTIKFTTKLSATRHATLGRCGESRQSNTLTVTSSLQMYSVCKQTSYTAHVDVLVISLRTCIYINSPN